MDSKVPIRSAEKNRKTCSLEDPRIKLKDINFQDHAAKLCIDFYRHVCPQSMHISYTQEQTVIAGILVFIPGTSISAISPPLQATIAPQSFWQQCELPFISHGNDDGVTLEGIHGELHLLSLGVGTKVLSAKMITSHRIERAGCPDERVRDMHAEVLARRGFMRFLYSSLLEYYRFASPSSSKSDEGSCCSLLQQIFDIPPCGSPSFPRASWPLRLRKGVSLHLYSSSQPCGNACIKRWAKSSCRGSAVDAFLPHRRLEVTARAQGEVT